MEPLEVQRVRGTNDFLPPVAARLRALEQTMLECLAAYAYRPIETPLLEPADLYLRKSGEEIAARIYAFTHWNRRLCLRPEATASVMRAYVNHLQDRPLPQRLSYAGASFRYEKPQRGRYRQYTEVGVECIGAAGPAADAEVLHLACALLQRVGLAEYRLVVGHLGVVLQFLAQLGLGERGQGLILAEMENLGRRQVEEAAVAARIAGLLGASSGGAAADGLGDLVEQFGGERAALIAADLLQLGRISLESGSRSPEDIIGRLLARARRADQRAAVERAVQFIQRLHALAGPADQALDAVLALTAEYGLDPAPVRELREALAHFRAYGLEPPELRVDLSLGRGLRYYTGLVFEIYADTPEGPLQLCGGGRYDDLVAALGGRQATPACGFSFGLERVWLALGAPTVGAAVDVLVAPLEEADRLEATAVAQALRAAGLRVELDVRLRSPKANLRYAEREGIDLVALVGERERAVGGVTLRYLPSREERFVSRGHLVEAARTLLRGLALAEAGDGR